MVENGDSCCIPYGTRVSDNAQSDFEMLLFQLESATRY